MLQVLMTCAYRSISVDTAIYIHNHNNFCTGFIFCTFSGIAAAAVKHFLEEANFGVSFLCEVFF